VKRLDLKNTFAFLFYEDERNGEDAIKELDGFELKGNNLLI
jgi:RNA recognition motif-containing protein